MEKHKEGYEPYAIEPDYGSDVDPPFPPPQSTVVNASTSSSRTARKRNCRSGGGGRVRRNSSSSCVSTYSASSNNNVSRPAPLETIIPQKTSTPVLLDETRSTMEAIGEDKFECETPTRAVKFETDSIADSQPSASGNNGDDQSEISDLTSRGNPIRSDAESVCSSDAPTSVSTQPTRPSTEEGVKLPKFSSTAPGLISSPEGISNISEILSNTSFARTPVVRLTRLTDIPKRKPHFYVLFAIISIFKPSRHS